jgi:glyoxylase-like metal-dependent hydrolase (beta-lactamase superfamily II)
LGSSQGDARQGRFSPLANDRGIRAPLSAARTASLWLDVGERIYIRRFPDFDVNVGLVVGDDAALLIDTRGSERQARELAAEIGWVTHNRLIVVNTHHHFDHAFGNAAFLPSDIWGHERCAVRLFEDSRNIQVKLAAAMPEVAREYSETQIVPPNKTFRTQVSVDLGGRQVQLLHLGRGHTDNDVVVHVPDGGVLFAGDLVEEGAPPSFEDSYPMDWPGTLTRVIALATNWIVPGHGDVVTQRFAEEQAADLKTIADVARRARFEGGTVASAIDQSPFPPRISEIALTRAFAQLSGEI